jgi:glycine/D-amino acid oxidase-like deaminating enzyme
VEHTRAVIIGGGVGGTSIAYHLAERGWTDIVLVDRAELTSGSTFHSAGLVGQLRSSVTLTKMMMYGTDMYRRLAAETGTDPSWHEVGSLRLASSPERFEELRRQAGWAKTFGLPLELISAEEAQRLFPPMSTQDVLGAAYLPTDGYIDPSQLTYALAEGARRRGAEINTNTRVVGVRLAKGRVAAVETDRGTIETEVVINAGGMYAAEIGRLAGVTVPLVAMAHEYLVLEPSGLPTDMPTMRDPSLLVYFRPESGGLIMGGLAWLLGAEFASGPAGYAMLLAIAVLVAFTFASLSCAMALTLRQRESVIGINTMLTLPLTFLSAAFLPLALAPDWIEAAATYNPINWAIQAGREVLVASPDWSFVLPRVGGLVIVALLSVALATLAFRSYQRSA